MSLSDAWDIAHLTEVILSGKQAPEPILAAAEETLVHIQAAATSALVVVRGMQAMNSEIQAARKAPTK